jgi:hypothetical protein
MGRELGDWPIHDGLDGGAELGEERVVGLALTQPDRADGRVGRRGGLVEAQVRRQASIAAG